MVTDIRITDLAINSIGMDEDRDYVVEINYSYNLIENGNFPKEKINDKFHIWFKKEPNLFEILSKVSRDLTVKTVDLLKEYKVDKKIVEVKYPMYLYMGIFDELPKGSKEIGC
jgi:signal recognition particle subunit SEC65